MRDLPPKNPAKQDPSPASPPGRIKIMSALRTLLREKEFNAITWADIAGTAGVNEGLIYKYFKDSRTLLHEVLGEVLKPYVARIERDMKGIEGAFTKLRKIIWSHFDIYNSDRVFARILLLEVRNFPGYFESETYSMARRYANIILDVIQEGVEKGEIRNDISPHHLRQVILGSIEHLCLPGVISGKAWSPDELTKGLCRILFEDLRQPS